ncbi:1,4-beta-glucanase [Raphidocelis subcapitata]|uniref:1,4-beta-glucanase n=1 Tax=Raphidocelis subcapitata TaxID=307507 RepID=A0A2V0PDA8_9CHLO|nr:1,4-beta-glucanase [Raphidocelis subcapitata]|eukprot:GBF95880.1 1,4-beta-glucanase [Raphidocelis subcapitata]
MRRFFHKLEEGVKDPAQSRLGRAWAGRQAQQQDEPTLLVADGGDAAPELEPQPAEFEAQPAEELEPQSADELAQPEAAAEPEAAAPAEDEEDAPAAPPPPPPRAAKPAPASAAPRRGARAAPRAAPPSGAAAAFELFSREGGIFDNEGNRVSIKGINWFGLETSDFALHGLWMVNMNDTLDFVAEHFNAVRLPFSCELALDMDGKRPGNINYAANPELQGLTTGQVMDRFVEECAKRGLLVMPDMHRLAAAKDIPELWYDAEYPESSVLRAWRTIALRYKNCWNVFAADLNNEPHGCASWGDGNIATDWQLAAQRIGGVVLEANPKLLVFVEGVERNAVVQPCENCWWGGHIAGAAEAPVTLPVKDKLVWSPHVYGPDVHGQPYFGEPDFPDNMPAIWMRHFGYAKRDGMGPAICFGEWGGWGSPGPDRVWQEALAAWMVENDITDSFYWGLNPNSGDTGGVLQDDWRTPHAHKLAIIAAAHPNPTRWAPTGAEVAPEAPDEADTAVADTGVDPAAAAKKAAAAARAAPRRAQTSAGGAGAGGAAGARAAAAAAAPPPPPAGQLVFSGDMLSVYRAGAWTEGQLPCVQYDIRVVNNTAAPLHDLSVVLEGVTDVAKSWNCTAGACGCEGPAVFGLPDWAVKHGLGPGADCTMGVIVRGPQPTEFTAVVE